MQDEFQSRGDNWEYGVGTSVAVISLFIDIPACTVGGAITLGTSCLIAIGAEAVTIPVVVDLAGQIGGHQSADAYGYIANYIDNTMDASDHKSFTVTITEKTKRVAVLPGGVGFDEMQYTIDIDGSDSPLYLYNAGPEIQGLFGVMP